jgi:uncharacterized protein (DUF488 family)
MTIYTIGFGGKTEAEFYKILRDAGVKKLIDVRLWSNSIGEYFAWARGDNLATKCKHKYERIPELCPTSELLSNYKSGSIDWDGYEKVFNVLMAARAVEKLFTADALDGACFLCSEKSADQCHRRLVAEYLAAHFPDVEIIHL